MNTKSLILTTAMSLGIASLATAQVRVYMTGSTAGRAAIFNTITDGSSVFDAAPTILPGTATSGSSLVNFRGNIGGVDTILKCAWSGSEGGIADIAGSGTQTFLNDAGTATDDVHTVDLAAADNDKLFSKN